MFARSLALLLLFANCTVLLADPTVTLRRVPQHGLAPSAAVSSTGTIHLVYFTGEPQHGDLWYVTSSDDGKHFSRPMRVNSGEKSAVAMGGVRGPQIALGQHDRVHVMWNGSDQARPRSPGGGPPLLYCRINHDGTAFEPERNLLTNSEGLDGGASMNATRNGIVSFAWHGLEVGSKDNSEAARRVWLISSIDDGKNIGRESPIDMRLRGACACCGILLARDSDQTPLVLYRTAFQMVHRDMVLLRPRDDRARTLSELKVGKCVMSTSATSGSWLAWEGSGCIEYANLNPDVPTRSLGKDNPKHPSIAVNIERQFLIAWTEKTSWDKGGSIAWQGFTPQGDPLPAVCGRADELPAWGVASAVALKDGNFVILY
jgi:hypothetical protein